MAKELMQLPQTPNLCLKPLHSSVACLASNLLSLLTPKLCYQTLLCINYSIEKYSNVSQCSFPNPKIHCHIKHFFSFLIKILIHLWEDISIFNSFILQMRTLKPPKCLMTSQRHNAIWRQSWVRKPGGLALSPNAFPYFRETFKSPQEH